MRHLLPLFLHRIALLWRTAGQLYHGFFFFVMSTLIVGVLASDLEAYQLAQVLFLLSVFTLFLMTDGLWAYFYDTGLLDSYALMSFTTASFVLVMYVVYVLTVILPLVLVNALVLLLLSKDGATFLYDYSVGLLLLLLVLIFLIFMIQALLLRAKKASRFLLMLITLPLALPWFIFIYGLIFQQEGSWLFVMGLYFTYAPCLLFSTSWALKQVHV